MTPNRYKLLVMDIDGTLIGREGNISVENREALELAKKAGIHISLCTGRSPKICQQYIDQLGLDDYHMFFDGALIMHHDTGEVIHAQTIDSALVKRIVEYVDQHDIYLEFSSGMRSFSNKEVAAPEFKQRFFDSEHTVRNLTDIWDEEEIVQGQLVAIGSEEEVRAENFVSDFADSLQLVRLKPPSTDITFVVMLSPATSKGKALEVLAAHLGITKDEVAAVGDWKNDIPLLTAAGLGIAMGNAIDEVKEVADHVTLSVEDHGLAAAIKKFLL